MIRKVWDNPLPYNDNENLGTLEPSPTKLHFWNEDELIAPGYGTS
jgi:hypothetical protein